MMLQKIGMYGHLITFMVVSLYLFPMKSGLWGYWIGSFINEMVNEILKKLIKEPRPVLITADEHAHDYYGMPSGHAQHAVFSILYVGFMKPNVLFMMCLGVLMGLSIYERLINQKHTVWQIIVGGLIGLVMSGIVYTVTHKYWTTQSIVDDAKDFELTKIYE